VLDLLVRQRPQTVNALRGHLTEYGLIVPQGIKHIPLLQEPIGTPPDLPEVARMLCNGLLELVAFLSEQIAVLEKELRTRA
jgi:transposase